METQYLTDKKGKKTAVVLPIDKYNKLIEQLEDLHDVKLFDVAMKNKGKSIPIDEAFTMIESQRNLVLNGI